jgi:hypothetical protein
MDKQIRAEVKQIPFTSEKVSKRIFNVYIFRMGLQISKIEFLTKQEADYIANKINTDVGKIIDDMIKERQEVIQENINSLEKHVKTDVFYNGQIHALKELKRRIDTKKNIFKDQTGG